MEPRTDNGWLSCSVDASEEPASGSHLGRLVSHGGIDDRNARIKVFDVDSSAPTLSLFATRDIPTGMEILYDYCVCLLYTSDAADE